MKLGKFAHINPKYQLDKDVSYPFVEMANLEVGKRYVKTSQFKKFKGSCTKFQHRDTLMARITPCLQNGKVSQFISEDNKLAFGSTEFIVFKERDGISDSNYLYYLVSSDIVRDPAIKSMSGATGRQRVNNEVIENIDVRNLDIKTQKKIAGILSAYDDLIENNNKRIKILEEMAQMLYKEWFVNFKFPNHQNTKFIDSELGKIPEGWAAGNIGSINSVNGGYAFKSKDLKDSGYASVIKIKNIQSGVIDTENTDYIAKSVSETVSKFELSAGDILIAMTGAQVGKVGFIPRSERKFFLNQRVGKFTPNQPYIKNNQFLAQFLKTDNFQSQINNTAQGAAQPNISSSQIEGINLTIPSRELISFYEDIVDPFVKEIELLVCKNQNLRKTRDLLLPRLISGELSVENLEVKT